MFVLDDHNVSNRNVGFLITLAFPRCVCIDLSQVTQMLSLPPVPKVTEFTVEVFHTTVNMVIVLSVVFHHPPDMCGQSGLANS